MRKFKNGNSEPVFKGWELEKAILEAHKRGMMGQVLYVFRPTIRLQALCDAFRNQESELARADVTVEGLIKEIINAFSDGKCEVDEVLLRLACIDLKTRVEFMELWRKQIPMRRVINEGEVEEHQEMIETKDGPRLARVFDHPGFKIMSLNVSKATRERMGL